MQEAQSYEKTISYLPPELLFRVFGYLDADFLVRCSAVCRAWNALANQDILWKELCRKRWETLRHLPLAIHLRVDFSDPDLARSLSVAEILDILRRRGVNRPRGALEKSDLLKLLHDTRPPRSPPGRWTGKWKSSYIVAELDLDRTQLTFHEVSSMEWKFEFTSGTSWNYMMDGEGQHPSTTKALFRSDGIYVNPALQATENEGRWLGKV
ncbi:hypothetical protein SpCBS45565_g02545 [Spizellomyces sp. 'palustris']|nr:hypothetical protein SpCBS45565_g02545 [Spizellomyces sp. 'palustris']